MEKSLQPTRKWWVTQTTAMGALLAAWVNVGAWDKTVSIGLIGFASQAITSYLTPNHDLPGGVPSRSARPRRPRRTKVPARKGPLPSPRRSLEDAPVS